MERLTIRNSDGSVSQPTNLDWAAAFCRLAAYEDTGLKPEEIKSLQTGYRYQYESLTFLLCDAECKISQIKDLQAKNDTLKRLIAGEWVDTADVQRALGIDFGTGLKMFDFSRTAEWNPYPQNGQKITTKFRLKGAKADV